MAYIFEFLSCSNISIKEGNFYDFGSGAGRGIIAAAFLHPFQECIGVEYLQGLHKIGEGIGAKYEEINAKVFEDNRVLFPNHKSLPKLSFKNGDFLKEKLVNPSVILCNSTCFSSDLMASIGRKVTKECGPGTIVISFSKEIPGLSQTEWEIKNRFRRIMSWGVATIYIHLKIK